MAAVSAWMKSPTNNSNRPALTAFLNDRGGVGRREPSVRATWDPKDGPCAQVGTHIPRLVLSSSSMDMERRSSRSARLDFSSHFPNLWISAFLRKSSQAAILLVGVGKYFSTISLKLWKATYPPSHFNSSAYALPA